MSLLREKKGALGLNVGSDCFNMFSIHVQCCQSALMLVFLSKYSDIFKIVLKKFTVFLKIKSIRLSLYYDMLLLKAVFVSKYYTILIILVKTPVFRK